MRCTDHLPAHRLSLMALPLVLTMGFVVRGQDGDGPPTPVAGSIPSRVLDRNLEEHPADPIVIDATKVLGWDHPGGILRSVPIDDALTVIVGPATERDSTPEWRFIRKRAGDQTEHLGPYIRFVDGQFVPGSLTADGTTPLWRNAWLHDLPIELDRITEMRIIDGAEVPSVEDVDEVILANGDRVRGLIESIGMELVIDRMRGSETSLTRIPIDRVASFAMVNPDEQPRGMNAWFLGGHRLAGAGIRIGDDGYVRIERPGLGGDMAEVPVEFLRGIVFDAGRVVPLATIPVVIDAGDASSVRPWIPEPTVSPGNWPIDAAPIRLDGPLRATWTLPAAGCRFSATIELPVDSIRGSFDLVVRDDQREVRRVAIDASNPVTRIVTPLTSDRLTIEIEMGADGPFMDVAMLREAIIIRPEN
ncbi:MAG: hypothetical protein P8J59_05855 [Phycisphaerales bacterium]|nr:hypothetical protein [Phycisphaerales bacterium]